MDGYCRAEHGGRDWTIPGILRIGVVFGGAPILPAEREGRRRPADMRGALNAVLNIAANAVPEGPCPDASHRMLARKNEKIFPSLTNC